MLLYKINCNQNRQALDRYRELKGQKGRKGQHVLNSLFNDMIAD